MAYVRCRTGRSGRKRYTAYYRDVRGVQRSAGTFPRFEQARKAGVDAQARVLDGRFLDQASGRQSFERYVTRVWLPALSLEATTRQGYAYVIDKYLLGHFGEIKMLHVMPGTVREFFALLQAAGVGAPTVQKCNTVLCSIFNTAVNDRIVAVHPCAGVGVPAVVSGPLQVLSPGEFEAILAHLPGECWRLMAELAVESGCRWGELAELRARDLNVEAGELTVARTVVELRPRYRREREEGFLVKSYPKNRQWRRIALSAALVERLARHLRARGAGPEALLFPAAPGRDQRAAAASRTPQQFTRGGRRFAHGTLYAYSIGACRCVACRGAMARYRADRREHGRDRPAVGSRLGYERHVRRDWFRTRVWAPAVRAAGITRPVRVHDLRHASASWALEGGASPEAVRQRLGHLSLRATERYLHNLPGADRRALNAFLRIQHGPACEP